jgi:cysteine desulfurase
MSTYLDCNATTPLEPRVRDAMLVYFDTEYGNAGSRTHEYGNRAKVAVQRARDQVAAVVGADREEVIFTSGATESNNLALLGLAGALERAGRKHVISTQIEHKAILEPLEHLAGRGFDVTLLPPAEGGYVKPDTVRKALRSDTGLVSVMHVNNETGVVQPIAEIAATLGGHAAFLHVDAAQGFGKDMPTLREKRIDLLSVSAHKIYGPKGVGALVARRRGFEKAPLAPLMLGGGQERGLRPGTLPVPLIVGLGAAAEVAGKEHATRAEACAAVRRKALAALVPLGAVVNGDGARVLPHVLNVSLPGLDSEAVMVALKDLVAISNGSACTSSSYQPSHVLKAMGLPAERINGALRLSWCHLTSEVDWIAVAKVLGGLLR